MDKYATLRLTKDEAEALINMYTYSLALAAGVLVGQPRTEDTFCFLDAVKKGKDAGLSDMMQQLIVMVEEEL